jgi:hypothetical protein
MNIMATPKQIEAARINGRRSKGPVTPQGKLNSSGNNSRHGLLAQTVVLEGESQEGFNALLEYYTQTFQPQSAIETTLIETMTVAMWRLWRVWGAQKLALDRDIAVQDPEIGPTSVRAMFAMEGSVDNHSKPDVLVRYETTFDRQFKSAVRLLESQAKRRKPSAKPYFPSHPFGQTWKPEACRRDSLAKPENEEIPPTTRPQEVIEMKEPKK